ncbi:MAG: hypothetical protein K2M92_02625, partial [Bacteroidales bacterium]|nr:hypothetical protein [Bacteroidales bacterium]
VANATSAPIWQELGKTTRLHTGNNYKATPTKTTTYVASSFASKGTCQSFTFDTVTVVVKEGFYLHAMPDSNFCNPGKMLWAVDSVDAEDVTYTWVDSALQELYGVGDPRAVVSTDSAFTDSVFDYDKTYYLHAVAGNGCEKDITVRATYRHTNFALSYYDTVVYEGQKPKVAVIGSMPGGYYPWFDSQTRAYVTVPDSLYQPNLALDTNYYYFVGESKEEGCALKFTVVVIPQPQFDTAVCDYECAEIRLKGSDDADSITYKYADTLEFVTEHSTPVSKGYEYSDTTVTTTQHLLDTVLYHVIIEPYPGTPKEDTVKVNPFCDSIYADPAVELAYIGPNSQGVDVYREVVVYRHTELKCLEAEPGKKIICDTVYDMNCHLSATWEFVCEREGEGFITNCRQVDSVCRVSYVSVKDEVNGFDTAVAVLDCSEPEPPTPGVKTICDTIYTIERVREGTIWVYNRT